MKGRVLYLVRFYLLTVAVFLAAKWIFMLCHFAEASFSFGDMLSVWWHGLSLDLSTALYFFIIPFFILRISFLGSAGFLPTVTSIEGFS